MFPVGLKSEQTLNQAEIICVERLSFYGLTLGGVCGGYPLRSGFRNHWNTLRVWFLGAAMSLCRYLELEGLTCGSQRIGQ